MFYLTVHSTHFIYGYMVSDQHSISNIYILGGGGDVYLNA